MVSEFIQNGIFRTRIRLLHVTSKKDIHCQKTTTDFIKEKQCIVFNLIPEEPIDTEIQSI